MTLVNYSDSYYLIPISNFNQCKIDNVSKKEIIQLFPTRNGGAYYLDKFNNYLKLYYNIDIKEYCKKYILNNDWPKNSFTQKEENLYLRGKGILIAKTKQITTKENNPKFAKFCERISRERKGLGNPMYGKKPWNKDIDPDHSYVIKMRDRMLGTKASEEIKAKQRKARAESPLKARHTTKHSLKSIEKMKLATAKRWSEGSFSQVTKIHIKVRKFLETLNLLEKVEEEYQVMYFSMDFAFPDKKIAIECQGTYFHIDPRKYPNGPKDAIQRRNFGRDITKRKVCCDKLGWKIIEIWETEIDNNQFEEILKCKLLEYGLLNH